MSRPLALTDEQYAAVVRACQPMLPPDRSRFLVDLANALRAEPELDDGIIFRTIRELRGRYWRAPQVDNDTPGRHSRRTVGPAIL